MLTRFDTSSFQLFQLLDAVFPHRRLELLPGSELSVNIGRRFHGTDDQEGAAMGAVGPLIGSPMSVRNALLIAIDHQLNQLLPFLTMSRANEVLADLQVVGSHAKTRVET